jgi:hypothetical protein
MQEREEEKEGREREREITIGNQQMFLPYLENTTNAIKYKTVKH